MKSIVQEASSLAKAIEQGLQKAGNPRDFAIKVLEYPEKNFFGLTTKPAKIALYYDERIRKPQEPYTLNEPEQTESKPERQRGRVREPQRPERQPRQRTRSTPYTQEPEAQTHTAEHRDEEVIVPRWTPDTIRYAQDWLTRVLTEMHRLVPFTIEAQATCLRINLDRPLFTDPEHERKVLASLSLLLIETSKHAFRLNLRGHKVLLTHRTS